jgi:DNA-binding response OmpR family regulator
MPTPSTIIVADPDPLFSNPLRVVFSHVGFAVLMASTGPEAEAFASQTRAHLVMLDAALPSLGSYDACARIRRQAGYEKTPILFTVREIETRIRAAAIKAGATCILGKPYAIGDVMNELQKHVAADDPLLAARAGAPGMAERQTVYWGRLGPLTWKSGPNSGLSQNAKVLPIMRGTGVRIPLVRKP